MTIIVVARIIAAGGTVSAVPTAAARVVRVTGRGASSAVNGVCRGITGGGDGSVGCCWARSRSGTVGAVSSARQPAASTGSTDAGQGVLLRIASNTGARRVDKGKCKTCKVVAALS